MDNEIQIKNWDDIKDGYELPEILFGNGFSMSFSAKFSYNSLFKIFINSVHEPFKTYFEKFKITNFEEILLLLENANKVNIIFDLDSIRINESIKILKDGLISAINKVHPLSNDMDWARIEKIAEELENFGDIYTTNYDLFLYHIIMIAKDIATEDKNIYQDYFWGKIQGDYNEFIWYNGFKTKNVSYLHGSLFIYNRYFRILKLTRNIHKRELIEIISTEINDNNFPLFVTEGENQGKVDTIKQNLYLNFCFKKLTDSTKPLLIYGQSLSDQDSHIIKTLRHNQRDLIISIYTNKKSGSEIQEELNNYMDKFPQYKKSIVFINSSSLFN